MHDDVFGKASAIYRQRYAGAQVAFVAGSMVRGEATAYSDIDLVVIYGCVGCAYRESFRWEQTPVEAFVHDADTLRYFMLEVDRPTGVPALAQMVSEGLEIPGPNPSSRAMKELAASVLESGPPVLTTMEKEDLRYRITDLVDDIRAPRSNAELLATGSQLYPLLADYYLRTSGRWSARGKTLPRALRRADPELCERFCRSFEALFARHDANDVIRFAEESLQPDGGLLFEGYRRDAPARK